MRISVVPYIPSQELYFLLVNIPISDYAVKQLYFIFAWEGIERR
jgi:hypothetical protein